MAGVSSLDIWIFHALAVQSPIGLYSQLHGVTRGYVKESVEYAYVNINPDQFTCDNKYLEVYRIPRQIGQ